MNRLLDPTAPAPETNSMLEPAARRRQKSAQSGPQSQIQGPRLARRGFLRGAGAVLALPFMESLVPKMARAQGMAGAGEVPVRFLGYFCPCGMRMDTWTPAATGRNFALSPALEPLAPVQDDLLVLTKLSNDPRGDHTAGTTTFLTAKNPAEGELKNGVSLDQMIAELHLDEVQLRSLELGCEAERGAGGTCDANLSCAYEQSISWATPFTPMAKEINPRAAFDRLFGADALLSPEERAIRRKQDKSILDFVVSETQRLKPRLGARDKRKLDQYLTGVRELETRLVETADMLGQCSPGAPPVVSSADVDAYVRQMFEILALGFQCDITRAGTLMLANSGTGRAYTHLGVIASHHELSHHQGLPGKLDGLLTVNRWEVDVFSEFLQRLAAIEEEGPNGEPVSALHNTIAVMGSELSDGNAHNADDMPVLVAGRGGGLLDSGRHVRFPDGTRIADLYLTLAQVAGVPVSQFGEDGVELLPEILA